MNPDISIVVPAYNRVKLLRETLRSVEAAISDLSAEIIIVDDGSDPPLQSQLAQFSHLPIRYIRQENSGLVFAKNTGLSAATGTYVLFLDSDDLIHPRKLTLQIQEMGNDSADVSYSDSATVSRPFDTSTVREQKVLPVTGDPAELYLVIQPLPHSPIYRTAYLQTHLNNPIVPAEPRFNSIGEVWMYYNLAPFPAKIVKVPEALTFVAEHDQNRITDHWERLGIASIALMQSFTSNCPHADGTYRARQICGERALHALRRLPRGFHARCEAELIKIWLENPKGPLTRIGGKYFVTLAKTFGILNAIQAMRLVGRPRYSAIRTIESEELERLVHESMS